MAALPLVRAGARVLMVERGDWVTDPLGATPDATPGMLSRYYTTDAAYNADTDLGRKPTGAFFCVGGPTVFYAGVSLRYREADFVGPAELLADSGARWPYDYHELAPYYADAEAILGVSGESGADPNEPPRSGPYAMHSPPLTPTAQALHTAAHGLGLHPFRPPLSINRVAGARAACNACRRCDGYACAIGAKGNAATVVQTLVEHGMELRSQTAAVKLHAESGRVTAVDCVDVRDGRRYQVRADNVILAAGALATPHLLLASDLISANPGGRVVGRYLTRHCNAAVLSLFRRPPGGGVVAYKEFAIHDFYFGHPSKPELERVGIIQQTSLPTAQVLHEIERPLRPIARKLMPHVMGLIVIAEDQPVFENHVALDAARVDALGMPTLNIHHRYTKRDLLCRSLLIKEARRIHRAAGSIGSAWRSINTFSHALGTVRMGDDPATSALDANGRYRGIDNLYVTDGSALPTSAAVNPSLTIAATALRAGTRLAGAASMHRGASVEVSHQQQ